MFDRTKEDFTEEEIPRLSQADAEPASQDDRSAPPSFASEPVMIREPESSSIRSTPAVTSELIKPVDDESVLKEEPDQVQEDTDELTADDDDDDAYIAPVSRLLLKDSSTKFSEPQGKPSSDVRVRASTAAAVAFNDNPKAVETCVKLLKVIISRHRHPVLAHSPLKQFGFEQVYLGAVEILRKIDSEILTHIDIREILRNLSDFSHNKLRTEGENIRADFVQALITLMVAVAELANVLEKLSGLAPIDWMEGSMIIRTKRAAEQSPGQRVDLVIPFSEFTSHRLIGTGTFGNVYKVRYKDLWFAMKIVPFSKFPARYPSQAYIDKAVQEIAHDFVIGKIFCTFVAKPNCYVMLMDVGQKFTRYDLERVVRAARYFSTESLDLIVYQLICAVGHLHLNGFIHRDLCLSNILIDATGHTRLIDFDSGKICRGHFTLTEVSRTFFRRTALEFTDTVERFSTPYTAPEILKGFSYGRASDWWSVGIIVYKCATGRLPFRAAKSQSLRRIILAKKYFWPAANHSATKEAREFVYDLLRKKPTQRLGSRSYADLHNHPFMEQCAARVLKARDAKHVRRDLATLRQKLHSRTFLVDFSGVLGAVASIGAELAGSLRFEDLADAEHSEQQALYTYASTKGRKIFDRLEKKLDRRALNQVVNAFMGSKTPPQEHVDFTRFGSVEIDAETTENRSRSDTHMQRLAFNERVSVNLPVKRHRMCFCRRVAAVDLAMIVGDGGLFYPAVTRVPEISLANPVVVGDLIAVVGGQRTGDLTLCNIRNIIHRDSANRQSITVEVMSRNVFRRIIEAPLEFRTFLTVVPRAVVHVPLFSNRHRAVRTAGVVLEGHGPLYIVSYLMPSMRHKIQGNLCYGDVILEVNGHDVRKVGELDFTQVFKLDKTVVLRIAETSVLRRSDLRDALLDN